MTIWLLADILIAYVLDLVLGDPYWLPHPVTFIGKLVNGSETVLRKLVKVKGNETAKAREFAAGIILLLVVVLITSGFIYLILWLAGLVSPILFHIINIYFLYTAFATKCLAKETNKVYSALKGNDIHRARKELSMLVGRQTENLNEQEIVRGAVETVAENTVDGIISPLIYAFIGSFFGLGAPLAYAFKAVSTLDSMVGYMNEKYLYFGCASAKTDDAANYIPARLSGLIIPFSALICGKSFKNSFLILLRDRRNHKSPNCAYPEAAVAGALGVRLGGSNVYFGNVVEKPTIGDPLRELISDDIKSTIKIMYAASAVTMAIIIAIGAVFII